MTSVGITATRHGLTDAQRLALGTELAYWRTALEYDTFRHGDCVGGDAQGVDLARALGYRIVAHPPTNEANRAFLPYHESLSPRPYLERNQAIVDASAVLLACPDGPERLRSGTWSTVRYARRTHCTVKVIMPDGSVTS